MTDCKADSRSAHTCNDVSPTTVEECAGCLAEQLLSEHGWSHDSEGFATMDHAALIASHDDDHES